MEDSCQQQQQPQQQQWQEEQQFEQHQTPKHGPQRGHESRSSAETTLTTSTAPTTPDSRPADADDRDFDSQTPKMAHDSMVTVRLSEPPALTLDTSIAQSPDRVPRPATFRESMVGRGRQGRQADGRPELDPASPFGKGGREGETAPETPTDAISPRDVFAPIPEGAIVVGKNLADELNESAEPDDQPDTATSDTSGDSEESDQEEEVDWDQLQKSEEQATKNEETDNSTAMLLARLEKENAKLATNPKSIKVRTADRQARKARQSRPPSMAQLKDMVTGAQAPALPYSMPPPPPMTDLEFWAALVKDYPRTAARLPTLLCNKIRKGIPPPLRGVVWQSMSGARDTHLEEQFDRLTGESSPHEPVIVKDLSRTFPGIDMFHDADGDGQRMLGRVLKCYSIFDPEIGYCQGLAFLVGPLLMHMPDKAAFCVLVRLMERYDLRSCFLPDLPGLHVRIYQFRELLRQMLPELSAHLDAIQVDPAYVSQWFLSFFAVTAPLPILFRIYDVIFAEGASESLMRVALSLMRKNQKRLLACAELEDAMTLLLSRSLWDVYRYDADEFVHDFVSLTGAVRREQLHQLERDHRQSQRQSATSATANANAALATAITSAASRFLGRIWASSTGNLSSSSPRIGAGLSAAVVTTPAPSPPPVPAQQAPAPSSTLGPSANPPASRPFGTLQRTASKQSLASTLASMEASSVSVLSRTSTMATSRDSSAVTDDDASTSAGRAGNGKSSDEKYLHSQIEDLLSALRELQRNQAALADELQREREEREEDRKVARGLLAELRRKGLSHSPSDDEATPRIGFAPAPATGIGLGISVGCDAAGIMDAAEERFGASSDTRPASPGRSKTQLQEELAKAKEQVATAVSQSQDLNRKIHDLDQTVSSLREQVRESHIHVRTLHQDKQRLEKQIRSMRARGSTASGDMAIYEDRPSSSASTGLREFKLSRSKSVSTNSVLSGRRISSTPRYESNLGVPTSPTFPPPTHQEHEALLSELVQAKTAEAVAKQEAEEAKQKLEAFKKAHAASPVAGDTAGNGNHHLSVMSTASSTSNKSPAAPPSNAQTNSGGFWGAWRRG